MGASVTTVNVVLGIFNAYMLLRSRRVSLVVVPTIPLEGPAIGNDPDTHQIRVQVVNLSAFPIYLSEAGLQYRDEKDEYLKFDAPGDRPYPILLNPRESVRVQPSRANIMESVKHRFSCAYVRTECGRTRRGTSPTLRQQELNVLEAEGASRTRRAFLRTLHVIEGLASRVGAPLW